MEKQIMLSNEEYESICDEIEEYKKKIECQITVITHYRRKTKFLEEVIKEYNNIVEVQTEDLKNWGVKYDSLRKIYINMKGLEGVPNV